MNIELGPNLFTEKELQLDKQRIQEKYLNFEGSIKEILEKEKSHNYPTIPGFVENKSVYSEIAEMSAIIISLLATINCFYFKLEINNKIRFGITTFENGFREYYDKKFFTTEDCLKFEDKIRNARKDLFGGYANIPDDERKQDIEKFWKSYVQALFFKEFPLFKYFISRIETDNL